MGNDNQDTNEQSPEREGAEELQRILQSDDIAPVDTMTYGKRLAEIILNALKRKVPWGKD
jgi:hypothetical protein